MASSSWGVPNQALPVALNGNVGLMTPGALQFYSVDGTRNSSIKFANKVISSFTSGPHAKKELLCLAQESSSTIDLAIYNANLESLSTIENVAEFTILAGALSSCGSYVTILSGLPEWKLKVFDISSGKCIIQHNIKPDESILHLSHCPSDWRQIALVSETKTSLISVQSFGESLDQDMIIVETVTQVDQFENVKSRTVNTSRIVRELWSEEVDSIKLNCEFVNDPDSVFTDACWRGKELYISRAMGDIWSLPSKTLVYGNGVEAKNLVSLQMETMASDPGQVNSLVSLNKGDDIIFCGHNGVFIMSSEAGKKKKKPVTTICKLDAQYSDKVPIKLVKLNNKQLLLQLKGINYAEVETVCFDLTNLESQLMQYVYNSSPISAACPSNDGSVIVARDNGQVQVYSSEIDIAFSCKLDNVLVELQQGPISGLYFGGLKNGSMCTLSIDEHGIKVLSELKLFNSPLDYLSVDPYGRGVVAASSENDRVLVLGWSSKSKDTLVPHIYGFVGVDGTIKSLSISTDSSQSPMSVLVALAPSPAACIDAAIAFELSADSLKQGELTHINNLLELDPKSISLGVAKLPNVNTIFMTDSISKRATCFASSQAQKQIRQIELELGKSLEGTLGFSRSLSKVNSHQVTFAKPFHGLWIASACRSGQLLISRNLNEKFTMPAESGTSKLKFDRLGSALIVYTSNAIYNVDLAIKPELQQRVVESAKKRENFVRPLWRGSSGEYERIIGEDQETTWFERQTQVAIVEQNNKFSNVKQAIEADLNQLREVVTTMLTQNRDAIELEKLDEQEFNLDEAAMAEYRSRETELVSSIQTEYAEKKRQAADIAARITKHYWNEMETGPRTLKSFNGSMAIENFEIEERHADQAVELDQAVEQRKLQIEEEEIAAKKERKQNNQNQDDDQIEEIMISKTGTLSEQILPEDPMLKSQFRLNSISDRQMQLLFIDDRIQKLKKHFNEQFNQSYRQKEAELNRIQEHNTRIEQIQAELELPIQTQTPELDVWEKPEQAFVVKDEEVKVERVLTDEQQAQLDEERRLEELRRAAGGDNWRDRGLKDMMDGVIEVKKEDVLKQDIPVPEFMNDPELHEADWTDEHKKQKAEYEKRVKQLIEDRAKHKKGLESEVKKLQQMVKDSIANFDVGLNDLYQKRLTINAAIHQEELKLKRLTKSIEWSTQTNTARIEVEQAIEDYRKIKQEKNKMIGTWRMAAEHKRQHVESQVQEEKLMEKQFKIDLEKTFELSAINIDAYLKYYKRRPKSGETMEQIDAEFEQPVGIGDEVTVWVKQQRTLKLTQEADLKRQNALLAKAVAFVESRRAEDEKYEDAINQLIVESELVSKSVADCAENLSIQLLLKQGQVEIEIDEASFNEAVFVHREVVEDLNSQIKQYGQNKIDAMLESKDFRKGIHMLEWERRRLEMEIDDLTQKAQDIQMLKLTRELQTVLSSNNTNSNAGELSRIDKTLQSQNETFRKKAERSRLEANKLNTQMDDLARENNRLDDLLADLHVSVSERRNIRDTHIQPDTRKIMRDIARRRKLVEISRSQQNEIALLRNELERLRKKTFPALVKLNR